MWHNANLSHILSLPSPSHPDVPRGSIVSFLSTCIRDRWYASFPCLWCRWQTWEDNGFLYPSLPRSHTSFHNSSKVRLLLPLTGLSLTSPLVLSCGHRTISECLNSIISSSFWLSYFFHLLTQSLLPFSLPQSKFTLSFTLCFNSVWLCLIDNIFFFANYDTKILRVISFEVPPLMNPLTFCQ